ncbi:Stf0 family sulfotransferase [Oceaniglobus indicus]|uniref:Stf0 family sulfotransferase n=1 Tax=Oceaniglobus indicus TaxID=2047749 RepID=UPI00130420BD|nr:Stf0 family sulfotransferase [Oceaniglobus indicus]
MNREAKTLLDRDIAPADYLDEFYKWDTFSGATAVGAKWMIGHHPEILDYIRDNPDIRILSLRRDNKLAQVASHMKAVQTKQWATRKASEVDREPIEAGPRRVAQVAREMATSDYLFTHWLKGLRNPAMHISYRDMFSSNFNSEVCTFLGVAQSNQMASSLVKQGSNDILSRFKNAAAIKDYFTAVGNAGWLQPEL